MKTQKLWLVVISTLLALVISACGETSHRIPIGSLPQRDKDLMGKTTGDSGDPQMQALADSEDCLHLDNMNAALSNNNVPTFAVYTSSVDVGSSLSNNNAGFRSVDEDLGTNPSLENVLGQALSTNKPVFDVSFPESFKQNDQLFGLLSVQGQSNCDNVTFVDADGKNATFTTQNKGKGYIEVANAATRESRLYTFKNEGELRVDVLTPAKLSNCAAADGLFVQQSYVITWGSKLKTKGLNVDAKYIKDLGKHITWPDSYKSTIAGATSGLSLDTFGYMHFQNVIEKSQFAGSDCTK